MAGGTKNERYVQTMQGLRRSNAAQRHRNKAKYYRKEKHRNRALVRERD